MAAKDVDKGYHWSPSNTEIKGIIGVEKQLTSMINDPTSEVNTLNEAGIVTVFNSYGTGFKTWGNRSAAYPTSTNVTNFINIRRTADICFVPFRISSKCNLCRDIFCILFF